MRLRHQEVNFFANGDWRETSACGQRDHTPTCLGLHVADSTGLGSTARGESKGKDGLGWASVWRIPFESMETIPTNVECLVLNFVY